MPPNALDLSQAEKCPGVTVNDEKDRKLDDLFSVRYGLVVEVARRYAPNADLIPDIAQEAFLRFLQFHRQGKVDPAADPTPLLWQITKNVALRHWREQQKATPEALRKLNDYLCLLRDQALSTTEPDESSFARIQAMKDCVSQLPEKSRKLIELRYYLGTSIAEIADMHAVGVKTMQQAVRRIREKLRQCIERKH